MRTALIFSDRMVLQRHKPIRIWGTATARSPISAVLGTLATANAVTAEDGTWYLTLPAQEAARDVTLTLDGDGQRLEYRDILIGEVWIAGGQSNMEFQLEFDADREEVFHGAMSPDIRFFDTPQVSYTGQDNQYDYSLAGRWRSCTPEDLRYFSAVGFYFAERLNEALDVPIGVVGCTWGGSPAATWTNRTALRESGGAAWVEDYEAGLALFDANEEAEAFRNHRMSDRSDPFGDPVFYRLMRDGFTAEEELELMPIFRANFFPTIGELHPNRPGGLFETMVSRIAPYAARGVIWYQGESDAPHADLHGAVMTALIGSWRKAWHDDELPFLITQLAPFDGTPFGNGNHFPIIREQQSIVASTVQHTWMASSSDVGAAHDIHPKVKRPIGTRLALLALGHVYGHDIACDAPQFAYANRFADGVEITFHHGEGLQLGERPLPLEVRAPGGNLVTIDSVAVREAAISIFGQMPPDATIAFAWSGYYDVDLRNGAGIPAMPFRVQLPLENAAADSNELRHDTESSPAIAAQSDPRIGAHPAIKQG